MWNFEPAPVLETTPFLIPNRPDDQSIRDGRHGESAQ